MNLRGRNKAMGKAGLRAGIFGIVCNFILFLIKLYVGISSNSLVIYCDAVNNLGDTLSCAVAIAGFVLVLKTDEKRGKRAQSLAAFLIGIILAVTGVYCAYNGLERMMYPTQTSYTNKYALLIAVTVPVKLAMAFVYRAFNKSNNSSVLKALVADSLLDCGITLAALMSFYLCTKIRFATDGLFSIIIGAAVAVSAVKTVIAEAKFLINN